MDCYLFSRRDMPELARADPAAVAGQVFFQMWRTRANPYNRLSEGDVVYIGDPATRRLSWEVRISALLTGFGYTSTKHALAALRAVYGLYAADLNAYHHDKAGKGWLLAWAPTVMRRLNVQLPPGVNFGQNGYRLLDETERAHIGLPKPQRTRLAEPPPWYDPAAARSGERRAVPRYIPLHVRQAVTVRDNHRCVACGATTNLHVDHIIPHSHGGTSTLDNLRLVCAASNLAKGAGAAATPLTCAVAAA